MCEEEVHIGIDDVDSWNGGCTTHFAFLLLHEIKKRFEFRLLDYPNLVRLNPNIPWKTRGNGAVCLRLSIKEKMYEQLLELLKSMVKWYCESYYDCDPGIAVARRIDPDLHKLSRRALFSVVTLREALEEAEKLGVEVIKIRAGMGLIGALASIGSLLEGDYTYEALTYRVRRGVERAVDPESVWLMEFTTWPLTFNNVDPESGRVLITPRGPDPVLCGVRGEEPSIVLRATKMIRIMEDVAGCVVYRTNQGTDAHYYELDRLDLIEPYLSVALQGEVSSKPMVIKGGHVVFKVSIGRGEIWCAAYKPSGEVREVAERLIEGDVVKVYGGVRRLPTTGELSINLEKLAVVRATRDVGEKNPPCPMCHKTLKSSGRGGLKCLRCGFKVKGKLKIKVEQDRSIIEGFYLPPPRSMRHLAKPLRRYGLEKQGYYKVEEGKVELKEVLL